MKSNRLSLEDFKIKRSTNENQTDVSKIMGSTLADCHDGHLGTKVYSFSNDGNTGVWGIDGVDPGETT